MILLLLLSITALADCPKIHFFSYLNAVQYELKMSDCGSFQWLQDRSDATYLPPEGRWREQLSVPTDGTHFDTRSFGQGVFYYQDGNLVRKLDDGTIYYYSWTRGNVCDYYQDPATVNFVWSKYPPSDPKHRKLCSHISGTLIKD